MHVLIHVLLWYCNKYFTFLHLLHFLQCHSHCPQYQALHHSLGRRGLPFLHPLHLHPGGQWLPLWWSAFSKRRSHPCRLRSKPICDCNFFLLLVLSLTLAMRLCNSHLTSSNWVQNVALDCNPREQLEDEITCLAKAQSLLRIALKGRCRKRLVAWEIQP